MYISTAHNPGDTVYYYDADNDSVDRAKVVQVTCIKTKDAEEARYSIAIRGSAELLQAPEEALYTRPESAFYSNPLPPTEAPA
jgi:hypothetical protein